MKKVFIGLLTFSLGAYIALSFVNVFAFTNPSANPPAGNVAPVFSSLTINDNDAAINGLVLDNDNSAVNGRFRANFNPATATTTLGGSIFNVDSVITTFTNNAGFNSGLATNTITPYAGINSAPIRIRGATSVENNLDIWGNISNPIAIVGTNPDVVINDGLSVTGNISNPNGDVAINDNLNITGNISITGDYLDLKGELKNNGGDVNINDKAILRSDVDILGAITASNDGMLDINGNAIINGQTYITDLMSSLRVATGDLNVQGPIYNAYLSDKIRLEDVDGIDANVSGKNMTINGTGDAKAGTFPSGILNIRNGARGIILDQNEIMSIGDTLYINDEGGQNVVIGNPVATSNLTVYGALNSSTSIGRFYSIEASTAVPVNTTDSAVAACDVGDFRIACSGSTSNTPGISFHGAWTSVERICNARLKNGNSAVATIYARAYCFSPNG